MLTLFFSLRIHCGKQQISPFGLPFHHRIVIHYFSQSHQMNPTIRLSSLIKALCEKD